MMRILTYFVQNSWVLEESVFQHLHALVERHSAGEKVANDVVAEIVADRDARRAEMVKERKAASGDDTDADENLNAAYSLESTRVVPIVGVIAPHASLVNGVSQPMGTDTGRVARDIIAAADDTRCGEILLDIDSPGGSANGIENVLAAIEYARSIKPVHAHTSGMAASGAYWIAARTDRITAARSAWLGSIGVFQVRDDTSKITAAKGITRHVIRSVPFKGTGAEGVQITEGDRAKWQGEVDALHRIFAGDIARDRAIPVESIASVTDGRIFTGQDSVGLKLSDGVGTFSQAIAAVRAASQNRTAQPGSGRPGAGRTNPPGVRHAMMTIAELREKHGEAVAQLEAAAVAKYREQNPPPKTADVPKPATFAELKDAFGAKEGGQTFIFECQEKGHSLAQAREAWSGRVEAENAELRKKLPAANAAPPVPTFTEAKPGTNVATPGQPKDYAEAVKSIEVRDRCKRPVAFNTARKEHPALHRAWCDAGCPKIQ